jgi:hypothetical protein
MARVFISYRRADTAGYAGRLHEYLAPVFGEPNIFMDIDNIPPGEDFIRVIEYAIQRCDVVLVLIGPHWATLTDAQGYRRLHDPHDFVRLEVATALARPNLRVVPVLVNDAPMPSAGDLPADLQSLTRRNAIELSNERFRYDVDRLIKALGGKPGRRGSSPAAYQSPAPRPAAPPQPSAASRGYNRRVWIFLLVLAALYAWFSGEYYRSNPDESLVFGLEFMGLDVLGFNILFGLPALTLILALFWPLDFMTGAAITFVGALAHLLYVDSLYTDTGSSEAAPLWILVAFAAIHAGLVGVVLIFSRGIRGFFRRR